MTSTLFVTSSFASSPVGEESRACSNSARNSARSECSCLVPESSHSEHQPISHRSQWPAGRATILEEFRLGRFARSHFGRSRCRRCCTAGEHGEVQCCCSLAESAAEPAGDTWRTALGAAGEGTVPQAPGAGPKQPALRRACERRRRRGCHRRPYCRTVEGPQAGRALPSGDEGQNKGNPAPPAARPAGWTEPRALGGLGTRPKPGAAALAASRVCESLCGGPRGGLAVAAVGRARVPPVDFKPRFSGLRFVCARLAAEASFYRFFVLRFLISLSSPYETAVSSHGGAAPAKLPA